MTIGRLRAELVQRRRDRGVELAVGQQQLGLAVLEAEGDQRRVEADVDRVQHRADHRRGVVRFQHGRRVGGEDRHGVAALDAGLGQRMRQPPRAGVELAVGETRARRGRSPTRSPKNSAARARKLTGLNGTKLAERLRSSGLSVILAPVFASASIVIPGLVPGIRPSAGCRRHRLDGSW